MKKIQAFLRLIFLKLTVFSCVISFTYTEALSADKNGDMDFIFVTTGGNCLTCNFLRADGIITQDTPNRFTEFVKKAKFNFDALDVHLNSGGGNLISGVRLGILFRELGVSTVVSTSRPTTKVKYKDIELY